MSAVQENLNGLQQWLGSTVGRVLDTALAIEPPNGTSPEWQAVLQTFEVPLATDEQKAKAQAIAPSVRGAPVQEVLEVMMKILERAKDSMEGIRLAMLKLDFDTPGHDAMERHHDRLRLLIDRLQKDAMNKYKSVVAPRRSMFDQAKAAAAHQKPMYKMQTTAFVARCQNCDGPRLSDKELVCDFCGARLG